MSPATLSGSTVRVPSSKSHTIRALLIAAAAGGTSTIHNVLDSADAQSCMDAIRTLGAQVTIDSRSETGLNVTVSAPERIFTTAAAHIDVGNSGTTLYLLTALAALSPNQICFDGDDSIRRRSAAPLLDAVRGLGGRVSTPRLAAPDASVDTEEGCAPYCVGGPLTSGHTITVQSPTSQYLSALLLAAPLIEAPLTADPTDQPAKTIIEVALLNEHPYVDMTCWWLEQQGLAFERDEYRTFSVPSGQRYRPFSVQLPGDYSSATFWFCAAAVTGTPVTVDGLAPDDVQGDRGVLDILAALGCSVRWTAPRDDGTASVTVSGSPTGGGVFDLNAMPDALPALAVLACYAPEPILFTNVPQARQKETDRIAVMAAELTTLGAHIRERSDGLEVEPKVLHGGIVESHGDHRVAMALAIAGLGSKGAVTINNADAAAVTYPAFFDHLRVIAPGCIETAI